MPPTNNSVIAVLLNIGHSASHRTILHPKGFTHDWSAHVTGADGIELHHFIEKVVFTLHETFEKPTQVVTAPPYKISESGYASFGLKLDIHFANKHCPPEEKIVHYEYDLFLPGEQQPSVTCFRQERVLLRSTPPDFRAKLLLGGAKEIDPGTLAEMRKSASATGYAGGDNALGRQSSVTDKHKSSDEDRKEKKKKHKDKSNKHKKSKADGDNSSKSSAGDTSSSLFGRPRSHDEKPEKTQRSQRSVSNSESSSGSSSGSGSPGLSPNAPIVSNSQQTKAKASLSASESSSDSDDERDNQTNSSNNNSVNKRPTSSNRVSSSSASKKTKTSDKPAKKSERNSGNMANKGPNGVPIDILLDLHEKINATEDPNVLQKFVDVVGNTNNFNISDTTFDFDLCQLDSTVIYKLENILK